MIRSSMLRPLATMVLGLSACLSWPAAAHYGRSASAPALPAATASSTGLAHWQWYAGASSGVMRVGLILVDEQPAAALPDPASLDFPATSRALRCESDGQRYRECPTPFHGPVTLSREVSGTRCVQDQNWGWREGRVWVDGGCAAVFVTAAET